MDPGILQYIFVVCINSVISQCWALNISSSCHLIIDYRITKPPNAHKNIPIFLLQNNFFFFFEMSQCVVCLFSSQKLPCPSPCSVNLVEARPSGCWSREGLTLTSAPKMDSRRCTRLSEATAIRLCWWKSTCPSNIPTRTKKPTDTQNVASRKKAVNVSVSAGFILALKLMYNY